MSYCSGFPYSISSIAKAKAVRKVYVYFMNLLFRKNQIHKINNLYMCYFLKFKNSKQFCFTKHE